MINLKNASFRQSLLNEDAFDILRNIDCLYGMRDYHLMQFLKELTICRRTDYAAGAKKNACDPNYLVIICTQVCNANHFNLSKPGGKTCLALMLILAVLIQFFAAFMFSESLSCTKKCDGRLPSRIRGTPIQHSIH